jgi:hypothetical protein
MEGFQPWKRVMVLICYLLFMDLGMWLRWWLWLLWQLGMIRLLESIWMSLLWLLPLVVLGLLWLEQLQLNLLL